MFSKGTSFTVLIHPNLFCVAEDWDDTDAWKEKSGVDHLELKKTLFAGENNEISNTVAKLKTQKALKANRTILIVFSMLACTSQLLFKFNHLRADFIIHSNGGIHLQRATSLNALLRDPLFHEEM